VLETRWLIYKGSVILKRFFLSLLFIFGILIFYRGSPVFADGVAWPVKPPPGSACDAYYPNVLFKTRVLIYRASDGAFISVQAYDNNNSIVTRASLNADKSLHITFTGFSSSNAIATYYFNQSNGNWELGGVNHCLSDFTYTCDFDPLSAFKQDTICIDDTIKRVTDVVGTEKDYKKNLPIGVLDNWVITQLVDKSEICFSFDNNFNPNYIEMLYDDPSLSFKFDKQQGVKYFIRGADGNWSEPYLKYMRKINDSDPRFYIPDMSWFVTDFVYTNRQDLLRTKTVNSGELVPVVIPNNGDLIIGPIVPPSKTDYPDSIMGKIDYIWDTIGYWLKVPVEALTNIGSTVIKFFQSATSWITNITSIFKVMFGWLPADILAVITLSFSVGIFMTIIRFVRGH